MKVTDKLPSDLKYISHTQSKGEFNLQEGVWDVGELAVNETVTLEITSQALKAGKTTNEVSVSSNEDDNDTSNNHANSTVEIEDVPEDSPVDDDLNEDDPMTIHLMMILMMISFQRKKTVENHLQKWIITQQEILYCLYCWH